jgi:hypothetical protein
MARKAQRRRKRENLAAQKERRIMATRQVFGNTYLMIKILTEMRKLSGVGPSALIRFSRLNQVARKTVFQLLPKRVWWTCTKLFMSLHDKELGNHYWQNDIGTRVLFLKCNTLCLTQDQNDEWWDDYHRRMDENKVPIYWRIRRTGWSSWRSRTNVVARKKMYLRWKNGGQGLL